MAVNGPDSRTSARLMYGVDLGEMGLIKDMVNLVYRVKNGALGSFKAQDASRTWCFGVRSGTQGDVPAPPLELCAPVAQHC